MDTGQWYLLSGGDVREEHELAGGVTSVPRHLAPLPSPTLPTLSLSTLWRLDMDNVITMDGQVSDWAICRVTPIQIRDGCGRQVMMNSVDILYS